MAERLEYYLSGTLEVGAQTNDNCNTLAFTPSQTYSVDTKIADGIANTGMIFAVGASCFSGDNYTLTTSDIVCRFNFKKTY